MESTLRAVLSSGHDTSSKYWHCQLKKISRTCRSPQGHGRWLQPWPRAALHWSWDCTTASSTAAEQELGPHSEKTPGAALVPGKERWRGLKGTKFINLEAQELPELCHKHSEPTEHRRGLGMLLQPRPPASERTPSWHNPLWHPPTPAPDFREQLHSKSMDLLDKCILYFSRWFWLDFGFGVGWLGAFLVWACLEFFPVFTQTVLMAVYNSRLHMLVLLLRSLFNDWHCKLCQSGAVLANSRAATAAPAITNCYFSPHQPWNCHLLLMGCTQETQRSMKCLCSTPAPQSVQSVFKLVFLWHYIQWSTTKCYCRNW